MRTSLSTVLVLTPTLLVPGPAFTLMLIRALTLTLAPVLTGTQALTLALALRPGALVSRLQHDGIAEAAGLLKGDRVLSINNLTVASASGAAATIRSSLGDVDVVVERDELHEV